jgi:hypothetical protein
MAMRKNRQLNARICFLLVIILGHEIAVAQDSSKTASHPVFAEAMLLYDFPQSYGVTAGINLPLQSLVKSKIFKDGKKFTKYRDLIFGVNGGFYRYQYNYTGVFLTPFIGLRHFVRPSLYHETSFGLGILRTFYDGIVYKVDEAGNVSEEDLYGRFYATTSFSWAVNYLWRASHKSIMAFQVKPVFWLQYPYNSFIKPHLSLAFGIKYQIAQRNIPIKTTTKHKH